MEILYPLLSERVSIKPLAMPDIEAFVKYRQDPDVARFQSWDVTYSRQQAAELIQSQSDVLLPAPGDWLQLAIHDLASGALLGDLALHALEGEASSFEIGFTLAKKHQGKGFGREAAKRLLTLLFEELGAVSVNANTDSRNEPSIKLLSTLGFKENPEKNWTEEFKDEQVEVLHFEISKQNFESGG